MLVLHGESLTPNSLTPLQRVGIPPHPTYFLQVVWPTRRADPASSRIPTANNFERIVPPLVDGRRVQSIAVRRRVYALPAHGAGTVDRVGVASATKTLPSTDYKSSGRPEIVVEIRGPTTYRLLRLGAPHQRWGRAPPVSPQTPVELNAQRVQITCR